MKVENSGMPEESYWNSLFNIDSIIEWLALPKEAATIVEIGCGYGTFTVPLAVRSAGDIYTFDIEPSMLEVAKSNARKAGVSNINFALRDVLERGTGLESDSIDMVLLFNILHLREKRIFLEEAARILKHGGTVAIIHWRKDVATPRGPAVNTRPDQERILNAIDGLTLDYRGTSKILEPYHWGMQLIQKADSKL